MRPIDADALIVELEKDEAFFDKEAEEARKNPNNCTEGYADTMWSRANGIRDAIVEVYDAPTIDTDRPSGEWLKFGLGRGTRILFCTNCEKRIEVPLSQGDLNYDFCPNCGAKMKGEDDE